MGLWVPTIKCGDTPGLRCPLGTSGRHAPVTGYKTALSERQSPFWLLSPIPSRNNGVASVCENTAVKDPRPDLALSLAAMQPQTSHLLPLHLVTQGLSAQDSGAMGVNAHQGHPGGS